jgi:hypothetical protein
MNTTASAEACASGPQPRCQGVETGAFEVRQTLRPPREGDQESLGQPAHLGAGAVSPIGISRDRPEPAEVRGRWQCTRAGCELQRRDQSLSRNSPRMAKCSADVLMMDQPIRESDGASERRGDAAGNGMRTEPGHEFVGPESASLVDADLVAATQREARPGEQG